MPVVSVSVAIILFQQKNQDAVPLFLIRDNDTLQPFTMEEKIEPKPGQTLVVLVKDKQEKDN